VSLCIADDSYEIGKIIRGGLQKLLGAAPFESFIQQGTHEDFVQRKDELQML